MWSGMWNSKRYSTASLTHSDRQSVLWRSCVLFRRAAGRPADVASAQRQRDGRRRLQLRRQRRRRRRCDYNNVLPARTASDVPWQSRPVVTHTASTSASAFPRTARHRPSVHGQLLIKLHCRRFRFVKKNFSAKISQWLSHRFLVFLCLFTLFFWF